MKRIIEENERRNAALQEPYDPIAGVWPASARLCRRPCCASTPTMKPCRPPSVNDCDAVMILNIGRRRVP